MNTLFMSLASFRGVTPKKAVSTPESGLYQPSSVPGALAQRVYTSRCGDALQSSLCEHICYCVGNGICGPYDDDGETA